MIYSRLLYTEHEHPHNDDGEGAFTIFSTQQLFGADCMPLDVVCIQKFAVLWEDQPDTTVIYLIEQSITLAVLSPVKLLNASKGMLVVVYDSTLAGENYELFHLAWAKIAANALYEEWTVLLIKDTDAGLGFDGGRIFRKFARDILDNNEIGITDFTSDMFLFKDEWSPENVFGPNSFEEANTKSEQLREGPDLFDDDLDSWRESTTVP
ncbi:hypothetical protein PS914_05698 [Pseudomonas fluorescens]|uniref:hypothetical protein n=1 Tax=Pseudomonas fluorescens TaxID=294 RepID=UPI001241BAB5|nr:hypothetical protein [Pseudomonas fluorescens]VVQ15171.1 hypothetical protein PS914_05698 [Pseudomonas fluorescens]